MDIGVPRKPRVVGNLPRAHFGSLTHPELQITEPWLFEIRHDRVDVHDLRSGAK